MHQASRQQYRLTGGIIAPPAGFRYRWGNAPHEEVVYRHGSLIPQYVTDLLPAHIYGKLAEDSGLGFGNASDETGSSQSFSHAYSRFGDSQHANFVKDLEHVAAHYGHSATVLPILGDWAPPGEPAGAETSTMTVFHKPKDLDHINTVMSHAGLLTNPPQFNTISFIADNHAEPNDDSVWTTHTHLPVKEARDHLDKLGIVHRTLQPDHSRGGTRVHIYDEKSTYHPSHPVERDRQSARLTAGHPEGHKPTLELLGDAYDAPVAQIRGHGTWLGDGSGRPAAAAHYNSIIDSYHRLNPSLARPGPRVQPRPPSTPSSGSPQPPPGPTPPTKPTDPTVI